MAKSTKKLVGGKLVDMDAAEQKEFKKHIKEADKVQDNKNELLDRGMIDDDMIKRLKAALKKDKNLLPIIEILIGKENV